MIHSTRLDAHNVVNVLLTTISCSVIKKNTPPSLQSVPALPRSWTVVTDPETLVTVAITTIIQLWVSFCAFYLLGINQFTNIAVTQR